MNNFINDQNWLDLSKQFVDATPFRHVIIDNFWKADIAQALVADFPNYESSVWTAHYQNSVEDKKTCNHWDKFPAATYRAFTYLNSQEFLNVVDPIIGTDVKTDIGLHGGGWHSHHKGGKLNVHLDYNIHPKLNLKRHYNLIIYMTPDWNPKWNGGLELWSNDPKTNQPMECVRTVENKFNRAVLFDTTQYSWHGLPDELSCPDGVYRSSIAVYYLTDPEEGADRRSRALFTPNKDQSNDPAVLELIKQRSN